MKKRIQNKIAESRWTFPIALGYGILVAMIQGLICKETILPIACVFLATLLMVEFNNRFVLITEEGFRLYTGNGEVTDNCFNDTVLTA